MKKRMLALALTICMVLSMLPVQAFAAEAAPVCTCAAPCTAEGRNLSCPVCGAEGAGVETCGKYVAPVQPTAEATQETAEGASEFVAEKPAKSVPEAAAGETQAQHPAAEPEAITRPTKPVAGYKITFNGNGGKLNGQAANNWTTTKTYEAGDTVKISTALGNKSFIHELSADYSTNYRFLGWDTQADGKGIRYASSDSVIMPDSALTLYAQWEAYEWIHWSIQMAEGGDHIEYTLGASGITPTSCTSFKAYCGNSGNQYGVVPAAYYSPVKAFAKDGYKFVGWYYGETLMAEGNLVVDTFRNVLPKLTMATSGAVLEARFEKLIQITYTDGVGGKAFADQVYYVDKGEAIPAFEGTPVRNGCTFLGWNPEVGETAEEDVTYVAQWEVAEPADPKYNTPDDLFTIHCTTDEAHPDDTWHWLGSHVVYNEDKAWNTERGAWTATLKVKMSQFLYEYQKDVGRKHYCTDESGKNITQVNIPIIWSPDDNLWQPDGMTTINIWCNTAPAAPVGTKLSGAALWVRDSDDTKNYIKYSASKLLADTYEIGEVTKDEDGNFWTTLTVTNLDAYADAFNTKYNAEGEKAPYKVDTEKTTATFTFQLKYTGSTLDYKQDGSGWTLQYDNNQDKLNGKQLWVKSFYTVTYADGVDGEELFADQTYQVKAGEATPAFEGTPTRENWNFLGWEPEVSDTVTADVTYVAQWEKATNNKPANSRKITKSQVDKMQIRAIAAGTEVTSTGGDNPWSCTPTIKAKGVSYTISDIQGNDVDGYTTTITFHFQKGDAFEAAARSVFNENKAYAQWQPDWNGEWSYTFTEAHPAEQTLTLYWVGTYSEKYDRWNYAWKLVDTFGNLNSNITSAVATLIQVELALDRTVTYTDGVEEETVFADQTYTVRNSSAAPAFDGTPVRDGYSFEGWQPEVAEKVYADVTYVAQWKKLYTVTYSDGKDGTLFADEVHTVKEGEATPAFEGSTESSNWIFKSWSPAVAGTVTADATYVAQWKMGPSNILRLDGNGGTRNGAPIYDFYSNGDYLVLRASGTNFTNPGYRLAGWNTAVDGTGTDYKVGDQVPFTLAHSGEVVVLYAQWVQGSNNVLRLNGNGGLKGDQTSYDVETEEATLELTSDGSEFTRTGYTFAGWNTQADGKGTAYAKNDTITFQNAHDGEVVELFAQWTVNQYTLTFDSNGGSEVAPITQDYGTAITQPEDPTRGGYVFAGWTPAVPETMPAEDMTVTAQWLKIVERLDFSLQGHGYKKAFIDTTLTPAGSNEGVNYGGEAMNEYGGYYGITMDSGNLEPLSSGVFQEEKDYFVYVTFYEEAGYTVDGLTAGDIYLDGVSAIALLGQSAEKRTLNGGKELTAVFDLKTIYLVKASAGKNGEIDPEGTVAVFEGDNVTFTITPDKGYVRSKLTVDGKKVKTAKTYTFKDVQSSHTIKATFAKDSGNAKTGDDSSVELAFHAMTITAGALAALLILSKKKKQVR